MMSLSKNFRLFFALLYCFETHVSVFAAKKECIWTLSSLLRRTQMNDDEVKKALEQTDPSDKLVVENVFRKISEDPNPKNKPSKTEERALKLVQLWDAIPEFRKAVSNDLRRKKIHRALEIGGMALLASMVGVLGYPTLQDRLERYLFVERRLNRLYGLKLSGNDLTDVFILERILKCSSPRWSKINLQGKPGSEEKLISDFMETYLFAKKNGIVDSGAFNEVVRLWIETQMLVCFTGEVESGMPREDIAKFRKVLDELTPEFARFVGVKGLGVYSNGVNLRSYDIVSDDTAPETSPFSRAFRIEDAFDMVGGVDAAALALVQSSVVRDSGLLQMIDIDELLEHADNPEDLKKEVKKIAGDKLEKAKKRVAEKIGEEATNALENKMRTSIHKHMEKKQAQDDQAPQAQPEPETPSDLVRQLEESDEKHEKNAKNDRHYKVKFARGRILLPTADELPPKDFPWGDGREWLIKKGIAKGLLKNPFFLKTNMGILDEWRQYIVSKAHYMGEAWKVWNEDIKSSLSPSQLSSDIMEKIKMGNVLGLVSEFQAKKQKIWDNKLKPMMDEMHCKNGMFFPTKAGEYNPTEYVAELWACYWTPECQKAWEYYAHNSECVHSTQAKQKNNSAYSLFLKVSEADNGRKKMKTEINAVDEVRRGFQVIKELVP